MGIKEIKAKFKEIKNDIFEPLIDKPEINHFNELYDTEIYSDLSLFAHVSGFKDQTGAKVYVDYEDLGDLCLLVLDHMGYSEDSLTRKEKKDLNLLDDLVDICYEVTKQALSYIHATEYGSRNINYYTDGYKLLDAKGLAQSMLDYKYLSVEEKQTEYPSLAKFTDAEIDDIVKEYTQEKYISRRSLIQEEMPHQKRAKSSCKVLEFKLPNAQNN